MKKTPFPASYSDLTWAIIRAYSSNLLCFDSCSSSMSERTPASTPCDATLLSLNLFFASSNCTKCVEYKCTICEYRYALMRSARSGEKTFVAAAHGKYNFECDPRRENMRPVE